MINFGLLYFTGTIVWKSRQMWNLSRRTWGAAAPAAALMKPAVAAQSPASKVPAAANAAACRMTANAAHCPTAQRNPRELQETRAAKGSCGGAAAEEGANSATSRAVRRSSSWSSAAQTPPNSTRLLWAAACLRSPLRTAATCHWSSAALTLKPHGQLTPSTLLRRTLRSPPEPLAKPPSRPCPRWSTTAWSSVRLRLLPSSNTFFRHLLHHQKRGGICTEARKVETASQTLKTRMIKY